MTYETILTERKGDVHAITLSRPARLNAASRPMVAELTDALCRLDGARAVLITGAGRAFCSGADLQPRTDARASRGADTYMALSGIYNPLMIVLADLPVPVVTAVNGPAAGIGCSIALAADFAIVGESAYFLQAFVNIGLVPDGGASWTLARLVGKARAMQMMMLGEKIGGRQAEDWGLVYRCVANDMLQEEALALAARLAAGPTVAMGLMRRGLMAALNGSFTDALATEASSQRVAAETADANEGRSSFVEKRPPAFRGL